MASLFSGVATELGLQVLLHPYDNSLGRAACLLVGVAYPAYATMRTLNTAAQEQTPSFKTVKGLNKWLKYWTVYGSLTVVEALIKNVVPWVPYYHVIKVAALLWLQLPRFEGAGRLYKEVIVKHCSKIVATVDPILDSAAQMYNLPVVTRVEAKLQSATAHIPILEWFMRGPGGEPFTSP